MDKNDAGQLSEQEITERMMRRLKKSLTMHPAPHNVLSPKTKTRPPSKGRVS